ncbi:hypothetical protein [Streptomyces pini]|nr:hypothetical protein [Streptomyces pini]
MATVRVFTQRFSSTPLGAGHTRRLALRREPVDEAVRAELDLPR